VLAVCKDFVPVFDLSARSILLAYPLAEHGLSVFRWQDHFAQMLFEPAFWRMRLLPLLEMVMEGIHE
jgi:hypothetical protein